MKLRIKMRDSCIFKQYNVRFYDLLALHRGSRYTNNYRDDYRKIRMKTWIGAFNKLVFKREQSQTQYNLYRLITIKIVKVTLNVS